MKLVKILMVSIVSFCGAYGAAMSYEPLYDSSIAYNFSFEKEVSKLELNVFFEHNGEALIDKAEDKLLVYLLTLEGKLWTIYDLRHIVLPSLIKNNFGLTVLPARIHVGLYAGNFPDNYMLTKALSALVVRVSFQST